MQRRKMLAVLGSVALGGTATFGTGAVTSVTADRSATVNVAGDGSAYIKLVPGDVSGTASNPNAAYAEYNSDDQLEINLDGSASGGFGGSQGNGVNPNAVTDIDEVFYIANQGTQKVGVWITDTQAAVTFYAHNDGNAPDGNAGNGTAASDSIEGSGNSISMNPGNTLEVSIQVDTTGVSGTGNILDDITVHADASEA